MITVIAKCSNSKGYWDDVFYFSDGTTTKVINQTIEDWAFSVAGTDIGVSWQPATEEEVREMFYY